MLSPFRRLLLAAALARAASSPAAVADPFSLTPAGSFSLASEGPISIRGFGFTEIELECNVTLGGSFAEGTIETTRGASFGGVTAATASSCPTLAFLASEGTPWGVEYRTAAGTMPDAVTGIEFLLADVALEVEVIPRIRCLYRDDVEAWAPLTPPAEGPQPYDVGAIEVFGADLDLIVGSIFFCPDDVEVEGTMAFAAPPPKVAVRGATWRPENAYRFGAREVGRTFTVEIELINGDVEDITVERLILGQPTIFRIEGLRANDVINRRQTKRIRVSFTPGAVQPYNASFTIESTGGRMYVLHLRGEGR